MKIRKLQESDHNAWLRLWQGYLNFYETTLSEQQTQLTWQRLLDPRHALQGHVAQVQGDVVGIAHSCIQVSTFSEGGYCYLEDLFVDPLMRGRGLARALIEGVADWAQTQGASKLYWLTQEDNYAGRMLYDKVAQRTGTIRYQRML
jgi:GNAT superfamily N-acetyltransferase